MRNFSSERLHDAAHHRQHLDVLVSVEMRGPMPAVEHELHLAGQFFFDRRGRRTRRSAAAA